MVFLQNFDRLPCPVVHPAKIKGLRDDGVEAKRLFGVKDTISARFICPFKYDSQIARFTEFVEEINLVGCRVVE
jgi:hypothetical protein